MGNTLSQFGGEESEGRGESLTRDKAAVRLDYMRLRAGSERGPSGAAIRG
jgi:hypothetical protein